MGGAAGKGPTLRSGSQALAGQAPPVTRCVALAGHPNSLRLCVLIYKMWVVAESTSLRYYGNENLRRDRRWRNRGMEEER